MGFAREKTQEAPAETRPRVDETAADETSTDGSDVVYPSTLRTAIVSLGVTLGLGLVRRYLHDLHALQKRLMVTGTAGWTGHSMSWLSLFGFHQEAPIDLGLPCLLLVRN